MSTVSTISELLGIEIPEPKSPREMVIHRKCWDYFKGFTNEARRIHAILNLQEVLVTKTGYGEQFILKATEMSRRKIIGELERKINILLDCECELLGKPRP